MPPGQPEPLQSSSSDQHIPPTGRTDIALADHENLRTLVDQRLREIAGEIRIKVRRAGPDAERLADLLDVMISGGKRLRAAFAYWSWRAHGGDPNDSPSLATIIDLAVALELFQAAALFHDDVIDRSHTRRNQPTAHVALAGDHAAFTGTGSAHDYGAAGAILLGDLALVTASSTIAAALSRAPHLDPAIPGVVLALWDEMSIEVTAGQFLDVHAQALPWGKDPEADEQRAREVILAKSARYSVELPLVLGAALAGAGSASRQAIAVFGQPLGEAFQLRDDLLGVFGDPVTTGKPSGDDIREGKRTVLMARAAAAATPDQLKILLSVLADPDPTEQQIAAIRDILMMTGAAQDTEALIDHLLKLALHNLDNAELPEPGAQVLRALAHAAVARHA